MTIKEMNLFYDKDKKEYIVSKNREFLKWLKQKEKNNYHPFISTEEIQELIDKLSIWYELKYPDKGYEYYHQEDYDNFNKVYSLTKEMTFDRLLDRLTEEETSLLSCSYRSSGQSNHLIKDKDNNVVAVESYIYIVLSKGNKDEIIEANNAGEVKMNNNVKKLTSLSRLTLDELYKIIKNKKNQNIDYHELSETIYDNLTDIELRSKVLNMTSLKILFSKRTNPEYNYQRAKAFENEFNSSIPNLNLKTNVDDCVREIYENRIKGKE